MEFISAHPDLQGLRRFILATKDAHGLYEQFGFAELASPALFMERHRPDVYKELYEAVRKIGEGTLGTQGVADSDLPCP